MSGIFLCRIFGAGFILTASLTAAFSLSSGASKRLSELKAFLSLLERIRLEIDCFSRPLDEIFASDDCAFPDLPGFGEALRRLGLAGALKEARGALSLSDEEYGLISDFAGQLGRGYRESQLSTCDYYITALRGFSEAYARELPKKLRLCRSISLLCGLSVIIILL